MPIKSQARVIKLMKKTITPEFLKFLVVGVISAIIEYSLLFLFKTQMDYKIANVFAFGLTNIVTFYLSNRYVFNNVTRTNKHRELTLFVICLCGALLVNSTVLSVLVEFGNMDIKIAKALAIAVTVIWNFVTRKHIVFRNREVAPERSTTTKF
jgi:putative flippase GtrA